MIKRSDGSSLISFRFCSLDAEHLTLGLVNPSLCCHNRFDLKPILLSSGLFIVSTLYYRISGHSDVFLVINNLNHLSDVYHFQAFQMNNITGLKTFTCLYPSLSYQFLAFISVIFLATALLAKTVQFIWTLIIQILT